VTLATSETGDARQPESHPYSHEAGRAARAASAGQADSRPVEFWPTSAIRSALETGDISVWQRIVVAIKRDPYGRTARQVSQS